MISEEELNEILDQVRQLCRKVNKRMKELGDVEIFVYRKDPVIKEAQSKICSLYRQAMSKCERVGDAVKVCKMFMRDPECLQQIMLSEEVACYPT